MLVRAEALAGELPRIDQLSNARLDWPRGFGQYTIGSRFLDFIRDQYGLGALRDLSHDFGSRAIRSASTSAPTESWAAPICSSYDEYSRQRARARAGGPGRSAGGGRDVDRAAHASRGVGANPALEPRRVDALLHERGPRPAGGDPRVRPGPCCAHRRRWRMRSAPATGTSPTSGPTAAGTTPLGGSGRPRPLRAGRGLPEFETVLDLYSVDPTTGASTRVSRGLRARSPTWRATAPSLSSGGAPEAGRPSPSSRPADLACCSRIPPADRWTARATLPTGHASPSSTTATGLGPAIVIGARSP